MFASSQVPRTGVVQPAPQWSHAVPSPVPWAQTPTANNFMRFQAGSPTAAPAVPFPSSPSAAPVPQATASAQRALYVHPDDPCSSNSNLPYTGISHPRNTSLTYPSTSYCAPRFKRKLRYDPIEQIPCKQLVTEKMLERMNDLSLADGRAHNSALRHLNRSMMNNASVNTLVYSNSTSNNNIENINNGPPAQLLKTSSLLPASERRQIVGFNVKVDDHGDTTDKKIIINPAIKDLVVSTSIEERLAYDLVKKSTMAIIPWSPPVLGTVDGAMGTTTAGDEVEKNPSQFAEALNDDDLGGDSSMEM